MTGAASPGHDWRAPVFRNVPPSFVRPRQG